jgi:diguanylate cyclase (GGDEF)-like protein
MLEDLNTLLGTHVTETEATALARNRNAKHVLEGAFALTAGIAVVLWFVTRSVRSSLKSLGRIVGVSQAMIAGNLDARCGLQTKDEIGELGRTIDAMAHELRETIVSLRVEAKNNSFRSQLQSALEMADTEEHTYRVVARAMREVSSTHAMELLLSDSSRSHLSRAVEHPEMGAPECRVESPFECAAVRRGSLTTFTDSEALDACPHLRDRQGAARCGVCVPISFMGRSLGVLHATGPVDELPDAQVLAQLENLGTQASARIGTVRAFAQSQAKAFTDSLTGLANRRSLESAVHRLITTDRSYAFVLVDLDHFKRLNDTYGHLAGDAALRRFAEVVRSCLRSGDMAARWGGEEFALLLPELSGEQGVAVCERLREQLAAAVATGPGPAFTASCGIVASDPNYSFEQQLRAADRALYLAKSSGRDQVVLGCLGSDDDTPIRRYDAGGTAVNLQIVHDQA